MALDFTIDTSGSPQDVQRKQALADALMKQGMDSSPAAGGKGGGWMTALNRGLAGALGGYERGSASNMEQQGRSHFQQLAAGLMGPDGKINQQAFLQASGDPWANPQTLGAVGKVADWQHTAQQDAERKREWGASFGLQSNADKRAAEKAARDNMSETDKIEEKKAALIANGIDPKSPEGKSYLGLSGSSEASLNPIYGTGADGKPAIIQTTKTGRAIQTQMPEGFQVAKDPIKVDQGTHYQFFDPQTRQPIGPPIAKNLAESEAQKTIGDITGKARAGLEQSLATANETLKSIELVRNHPGRGMLTTGYGGLLPGIPGTEGRGFTTAVDQLKGKTFLTAFNQLRGGGAITDAEGNKATLALARLDRAQNDKDFEAALNDLRDVVKSGMLRAKAMANGGPTAKPEPVEINGYKIEPQ